MKRLAVAGLALAASIAVGMAVAPGAFAADTTGPDTVGCATATVTVREKAVVAAAVAQKVADAQSAVIAGLKLQVAQAQNAYDAAYTAYQAAKTAANLTVLVAAQTTLDTALKSLADAPGVPAVDKAALDKANLELAAAITARVTACTSPVTVTPTPTPTPTTSPAPAPVPAPVVIQIPKAIDTGLM